MFALREGHIVETSGKSPHGTAAALGRLSPGDRRRSGGRPAASFVTLRRAGRGASAGTVRQNPVVLLRAGRQHCGNPGHAALPADGSQRGICMAEARLRIGTRGKRFPNSGGRGLRNRPNRAAGGPLCARYPAFLPRLIERACRRRSDDRRQGQRLRRSNVRNHATEAGRNQGLPR